MGNTFLLWQEFPAAITKKKDQAPFSFLTHKMKFIAFEKKDVRVCNHSVCSTSLRPANKSCFCSKHRNISGQQCSHDNCIAKIRKDNKSGFCKKHSSLSSSKESSASSSQPGSSNSIPTKQLIWPMVLCSYCNVLPVNALMNEKRKCQSCSKANNNKNVLAGAVIGSIFRFIT